jgi:hypothetical protein
MDQSWFDRVAEYLDGLQSCAQSIDLILDQTRVHTVGLDPAEVQRSTDDLAHAIKDLEGKTAQRDELLRAPDAPPTGSTLTEKLRGSNRVDHEKLATRCDQIAGTIEMANLRAVSLFVCQYNLLDVSKQIIRLLSGVSTPPTYGEETDRDAASGGTLFNEAA